MKTIKIQDLTKIKKSEETKVLMSNGYALINWITIDEAFFVEINKKHNNGKHTIQTKAIITPKAVINHIQKENKFTGGY
jgi:hypothetical protein